MARDPYRYFRIEARELLDGLTQGVLQLEKGIPAPDAVARLLRLAHTLKGAARVVKQPTIAELAHAIEGLLASQREAAQPLPKVAASELLRLLDEISSRLSAIEPAPDGKAAGRVRERAEDPVETLRVELQELDALFRSITEATVQFGAVREGLAAVVRLREQARMLPELLAARPAENGTGASAGLVRARTLADELRSGLERVQRGLTTDTERLEGKLGELRDLAQRLRLLPAQTVFPSLERSVRDAALTLGKHAAFDAAGGDIRVDANVLMSLRDALMHVVRNAVAHGVETEAERTRLGKPPAGQVRLAVERRGGRVAFVCRDDGRGIDVEAVRRAAVARGLVTAPEAKMLAAEQVVELLRGGGLTTSSAVTELSGRGIGLDVVRATVARLKGDLRIRSEPGHGTTIEIQVPISIASLPGLVVETAGALAAIPLDAVRQTLRVRDSEVARSAKSDSIVHEGRVIPFLPLERLLRPSGSAGRRRSAWSAVVVEAGTRRVAVGVDRLLGTSNLVMRALPDVIEAEPAVSGASLDAAGNPQLVLDPGGLVAAAERGRDAPPEESPPRRDPVLVVDDSLTTRMLEQSILESAGYEVELAASAEEALTKARNGRYSLFVVDVEMPGMGGFEFVAQTRADATLREIPAILVTSRNGVEDRRRGEEVGARAYVVKGEFDQGRLLEIIRALIGAA